jgi:hypothetical protein
MWAIHPYPEIPPSNAELSGAPKGGGVTLAQLGCVLLAIGLVGSISVIVDYILNWIALR